MVVTERDGKRTTQTPWGASKVVFLQSLKVGKLVYGILAEETRPNKAVLYEKADNFILLKKWHSPEPFAEFTSSQALALPVINNVSSIYILDAQEAATDEQVEGDAGFTYKTVNYTKASVIAAINMATGKTTARANNTDATLLKFVNELSEEQILVFEANIVPSV